MPPVLGAPAMVRALSQAAAAAVQPAVPGAAQCRASLRPRRPALFALPRCRPAIFLRLFRDAGPIARRRAARQEAPSRRQAPDRDRPTAVLDIGCGWGGLALYLAEFCGARGHRHHAVGRAAARSPGSARRKEPDRHASTSACRTIATSTKHSTASSRSACSSMSASAYYDAFFRKCAELLAHDGVMLLHSIGRSEGPTSPIPGSPSTSFPGGYIPALSEVCRRSSAPACWSPTSRSCACTMPRRCSTGASASWRTATRPSGIYDQRFVRMWEFYLAASEMAFREQA